MYRIHAHIGGRLAQNDRATYYSFASTADQASRIMHQASGARVRMTDNTYANTVMQRCDALAGFSEEPDRLTRRFATAPMRQANTAVAEWMRAAGMSVRQDSLGNLIGRYE